MKAKKLRFSLILFGTLISLFSLNLSAQVRFSNNSWIEGVVAKDIIKLLKRNQAKSFQDKLNHTIFYAKMICLFDWTRSADGKDLLSTNEVCRTCSEPIRSNGDMVDTSNCAPGKLMTREDSRELISLYNHGKVSYTRDTSYVVTCNATKEICDVND